ncbi:pyruvate formate lyase family protein [Escherichia coli]
MTKNSFRYLHTPVRTIGAPEPNLTILWHRSSRLPSKLSRQVNHVTSSLQYENDDLMRTDSTATITRLPAASAQW